MTELSDEELSQLISRQPSVYLRAAYDRYSGPLLRFIYRFTENREAAEEILQDIFEQLLSGKFHTSSGSLKAWLFTVAKNKSLNYIGKSAYKLSERLVEDVHFNEDCIETRLIQSNLLRQLASAEASLPEDLNLTWNLRKEGLDYRQIADRLSIPVGTVKSRFFRLVEYLKKELSHET